MKKTIFILLACAFAFVGCEDVTEHYSENSVVRLEVTSSRVVFASDGGEKTVLVTTNADWAYSEDGSWFSVAKGDGSIVITADANSTESPRYGEITVTTADGTLSESISVAQRVSVDNSIDLSAEETANCYMANTSTSYRFNALVKGNGLSQDVSAIKEYVEEYGTVINSASIVYADLLWEATLDADKTRSCNIIDGTPIYEGGEVWFTTGTAEGNAVIAVKDSNGNVLWSWHIWVTDQEIAETFGNGYYWMDRNLGANSTEELDVTNRGLLYQWGRKDPFLPSPAAYGVEDANVFNTLVGDGSGVWNYTDFIAKLASEAPGNIPLSVENPMAPFIAFGSVYSWYLTKNLDDNKAALPWGDSSNLNTYVKSLFDPCPAGYNVPVDNAWISANNQATNIWSTESEYGRYWTGGNDAYYPCAGAYQGITASMTGTETYGYYWTSTKSATTSYYPCYIYFTPRTSIAYSYSYPVHAMSVRCMRVN
ncbi:MAG: hypothetical protein LUD72_02780 [Bacteroidales bacterium]|nr:hypothetical protein [Bacteroidales bacterium]